MSTKKAKKPATAAKAKHPVPASSPTSPPWDLTKEDDLAEKLIKNLTKGLALLDLLAAGAGDAEYKPDQLQFGLEAIHDLCEHAFDAFVDLEDLRGRSGPRRTKAGVEFREDLDRALAKVGRVVN